MVRRPKGSWEEGSIVNSNYETAVLRRKIIELLPSDLPLNKLTNVYDRYGDICMLTYEVEDISIDHFIPIIWGHGGNIWGNLYPLCKRLNLSKKDANPFEWVLMPQIARTIYWYLWEDLINLIAKENELSVEELIEYVYWCEENKRTLENLTMDNTRSLLLWVRERDKADYHKCAPEQNYLFRFRVRQEIILEDDVTNAFFRETIREYRKKYYPIIEACKVNGKIKYIEKGKYSYKFKQIHPTARYLTTRRNGGIDIEEWSRINHFSIKEIFEFLKNFDADDYRGWRSK